MACQMVVVKNTFVDIVETAQPSPVAEKRARAQTASVDWLSESADTRASTCASSASSPSASREPQGELDVVSSAHAEEDIDLDGPNADGDPDLVQRLETATTAEAVLIAASVKGKVVEAATTLYGHQALEQLIHLLPTSDAVFIAEELRGQGWRMVLGAFGHSVICRLLEYWPEHPAAARLVDEILSHDPVQLCCHKYGHEVAMTILSNGSPCHQTIILKALGSHFQRLARHRFAALVMEQALAYEGNYHSDRLATALVRHPGNLSKLACHFFGANVVRALLELPAARAKVMDALRRAEARLRKDKVGSQFLADIGLAGPNAASQ